MGRFSELGQNKMNILIKLIENENLVKCLVNPEDNFLDIPLPVDFDASSLIHTQIFPFKFIPAVDTVAKCFITMQFGYKPDGLMFKNGSVFFYIIVHNSLLKTDYNSLRYDMLLNYIDETFSGSRGLGLGKLPFYDMSEFVVNEKYSGVCLIYKSTEFQ